MNGHPRSQRDLPPLAYRRTGYARARADLLRELRAQGVPDRPGVAPLGRLQIADESDWIVALCDAWAALSEVIAFYQERIVNEAFLPTAVQPASRARLYHSLGHQFPPRATATTVLAYHLSDRVAGVEAVTRAKRRGGSGSGPEERARLAGGGAPVAPAPPPSGALPDLPRPPIGTPAGLTSASAAAAAAASASGPTPGSGTPPAAPASLGVASQVPPIAQVKAIPGPGARPPVFVTLQPLAAYVGLSRLTVRASAVVQPPSLDAATTQLELAGTRTRLQPGQPILLVAYDQVTGSESRWTRFLTSVKTDDKRNATRIGWDDPLGSHGAMGPPVADPVVYGFASSSQLVGSQAPPWTSLPAAQQMAVGADDGTRPPIRGGFASSTDGGATWTLSPGGLPATVGLTAIGVFGDVVIVGAGKTGLLRSVGGGPFTPVTVSGPRRFVFFIGGTADKMLAATSNGGVFRSIDGGLTWSPIAGAAPELKAPAAPTPAAPATPPTPPTAPATPPTPTIPTVVINQLPTVAVRCLLQTKFHLLAGTDAGLYVYREGKWRPHGYDQPVFAMALQANGQVAIATQQGVSSRQAPTSATDRGTWDSLGTGLDEAAYALAVSSAGTLFAGTATGVVELAPGQVWQPAGADTLSSAVTTLLATDGLLLAGGSSGLYRSADAGATWERSDRSPAFSVPADALSLAPGAPPDALLAAFARYGIVLQAGAALTGAGSEFVLANGADRYDIEQAGATQPWQVWLLDSLPNVAALGATTGMIVAAAGAPSTLATDWPGFAVAGDTVELAPPVKNLAPDAPALIEQRTGPDPVAQSLSLTKVEQDTVSRFAKKTPVTRLTFAPPVAFGEYPRSATNVWTGGTALPLLPPPPPPVMPLPDHAAPAGAAATIPLAESLSAPLERGRLATVTGAPIGLTVAPLGGALHVSGGATVRVGPAQVDVPGVAIDQSGYLRMATSDGVFAVPATGGSPTLMALGWPGGRAFAVALAGQGGTVLAGSKQGVYRSHLGAAGAASGWERVGLAGDEVVALASGPGATLACTASGSVYGCQDPTAENVKWNPLPAVGAPIVRFAVAQAGAWAATSSAVFALGDDAQWQPLREGFVAARVSDLVVDGSGTLWVGSSQGLQSLPAGATAWRRDAGFEGPAQAICIDPDGDPIVAGASGLFRRSGAAWQPTPGAADAPVSAMAVAADESLWLGTRAQIPLEMAAGNAPAELRHARVFGAVGVGPGDLQTLGQGALPDVLLDAFADNGVKVDTAELLVRAASSGAWLAQAGADVYVIAVRDDGAGKFVDAYRSQATIYATAPPARDPDAEVWQVEVNGAPATLRTSPQSVVQLPAGDGAPSFAETVNVTGVQTGPQAGVTVAGAGTVLTLARPLAHVYDASTVQVNLNVVSAAQGQPVSIPIGSGDPQVPHQAFSIPTPIAAVGATAADPGGTPRTSLRVYVDGQAWKEVPQLRGAAPGDAVYALRHNPDGTATVHFGDGEQGARLPAGKDNVIATYLQGGGPAGEVPQGALIQPVDQPQLVSQVHNPIAGLVPATPAPAEARTAAVRSLDRIVTLGDYEDMALAQAGVATAAAEVVAGGAGRSVVVTIAATTDAALDVVDRVQAELHARSASGLPVRVVAARDVPVRADVQVVARDDAVVTQVRTALDGLGARRPGDPLLAAQVLTALAAVPGVSAASVLSWNRAGLEATAATSVEATGASWPASAPAPRPAELLVIDGRQGALSVSVAQPEAVPAV